RYAVLCSKCVITRVMSRATDGSGAKFCQGKVSHPNRKLNAANRVNRIPTSEYAFFLKSICGAIFGADRCAVFTKLGDWSFGTSASHECGNSWVFRRQDDERIGKQPGRIGAKGLNSKRHTFHRMGNNHPLLAADPVALHGFNRLGPIKVVEHS